MHLSRREAEPPHEDAAPAPHAVDDGILQAVGELPGGARAALLELQLLLDALHHPLHAGHGGGGGAEADVSVRPDDQKRDPADAQPVGRVGGEPCERILSVGPGRERDGRFDDGRVTSGPQGALESREPVAEGCPCPVCARHSRAYLHYLSRAGEPTAARLLTIHNLTFMARLMEGIRVAIDAGRLAEYTAAAMRGEQPYGA